MNKHIDLAKKLKALADKGVGGEKTNAEKMLMDLLSKHKLTIEDIEGEKVTMYFFKASGEKVALLSQIIKRVSYDLKFYDIPADVVKRRGLDGSYATECTAAQYVEIESMIEFYWRLYKEELKVFYHAFLDANDLLAQPPVPKTVEELSPEELEKWKRSKQMSSTIKSETHRKQIQKAIL